MGSSTRNVPLDLIETAQAMLDASTAVTTGLLHLASPAEVVRLLSRGDQLALYYYRHELARQVASAVLMMDSRVVAVFEDRDAGAAGAVGIKEPLRLWVQVTQQTAALHTVLDALNEALGEAHAVLFGEAPDDAIDTIVVDEDDDRLLRAGITSSSSAPVLLVHRL